MDASFPIDTTDDADALRAEALATLEASIGFDRVSRPARRRAFSSFLRTLLLKGN